MSQRTHAYILYCRLQNMNSIKLIEKYKIGYRGSLIAVQDIDILITEREGGKDQLKHECPWLCQHPVLVNTRLLDKFFGFRDIEHELTQYHKYLDHYFAALQERSQSMTLPTATYRAPTLQPPLPTQPQTFPYAIRQPDPIPPATTPQQPQPNTDAKRRADKPVSLPPADITPSGQQQPPPQPQYPQQPPLPVIVEEDVVDGGV